MRSVRVRIPWLTASVVEDGGVVHPVFDSVDDPSGAFTFAGEVLGCHWISFLSFPSDMNKHT